MTTIETTNPATGTTLGTYELMTSDEVTGLLDRAHEAFVEWRATKISDRAVAISQIGQLLRERADDLATLMTNEMGKLRSQARQEIELCAAICDFTAGNAEEQLAPEERSMADGRAVVSYQPVGVILGIQPFNFPIYQALRFSVPQLAAGNTVLLKHAKSVSGCALALEQLYHDAGIPTDAFRAIIGSNDDVTGLIASPKVRGVTLTGSAEVGSKIAAEAGRHLKKTVMELGSNDAYLVLADADLELAIKTSVMGRMYNNGETCVAAKRFVVVDSVYDEFRDGFVKMASAMTMGDPHAKSTDLGPIAREDLREQLHGQVVESVKAGATVAVGGELPEGEGFFYPATVLENVRPGMPAYDGELFGPVASLIRVSDDAEAIRVANDSRFGLGGGIFSRDVGRAVEMATHEFDTGMVNVNGYHLADPELPFGGVKDSGFGREHGGFGIKEFVNIKTVRFDG